jgi:hypothetical protein
LEYSGQGNAKIQEGQGNFERIPTSLNLKYLLFYIHPFPPYPMWFDDDDDDDNDDTKDDRIFESGDYEDKGDDFTLVGDGKDPDAEPV